MTAGTMYGLIWGIAAGVSMGYGTYAVMPIPYYMALTWFLGTVVEGVVAGVITAAIVKEVEAKPVAASEAPPSPAPSA